MAQANTEAAPIVEGETIAGKYRVGRILGKGGMGVVVAATHLQLDQRVALKFLLPEAAKRPEIVERFAREARAAARIRSEHVVRILDVGELETGAPYMVMEYLEGEDLEQVLVRRGALPVGEAIEYVLQGCEAVAEAHALGIVHRDLKPANLFLAQRPGGRPVVKVLDFGISKSPASTTSPGLTQTAAMFGSPPYMSPEQVRSTRSVDARSDIWALGALFYELLTMHKPFPSESPAELFVAILYQEPIAPRVHRPDLPPLLEAAVQRCLQKDPALRFQDVAALAAAIGPFGPPSSAELVGRISHVLGIGRAPAPPALVARSAADQAALGGMPTAATPETLATSSTAVPEQAPPAPTPPAPTPPAPAPVVSGGTAPAPVVSGGTAPAPVVSHAAFGGGTAPTPSSARGGLKPILVGAALLVAAASGAAYWFGARRPPQSNERTAAGEASASPLPPAPVETTRTAAVAKPLPAKTVEAAVPAREASAHPGGAPPREHARAHAGVQSTTCAELLERMSLGEALSAQDKATYARQCNKR